MTKDEALRLALEALERSVATCLDQYSHEQVRSRPEHFINQAITAIKAALEAKDEPVAVYRAGQTKGEVYHVQFLKEMAADEVLLYAKPQDLQLLTDDEILLISVECSASHQHMDIQFARAIEAKLKERNS